MNKQKLRNCFISFILSLAVFCSSFAYAEDVNVATNTAGVGVPGFDVTFITRNINVPVPSTLVIHYFGECQVPAGHIEYDILVNNSQISPTHDNTSALCSGPQSPATVGTVVACRVSAGNYTVRVRGHVVGGLAAGLIDDQSLVIEEHTPAGKVPNCIGTLPLQVR